MRRWGALLLLGLMTAGCVRGSSDRDEGRGESLLTPQFDALEAAPTDATSSTTAARPGGASTTTETMPGSRTTTTTRPAGQVAPPVVTGATTAAVVDRQGDLTLSVDPPPAWADLVGGTLIRRADGFELRVRLGGGTAPTTTDEDHTMNVASFYDVDGDGRIDFEVWVNLAANGWGPSWFDNTRKKGRFGDKSGVTVAVERDEVVLRFPLSHIGGAERLRWSLASEWGRYEVLGTDATARDDAPDFDAAARFPG